MEIARQVRGTARRAAAAKPFLRIAIRLAWRDVLSSRAKFLLIIVAIAAAVAIVTSVLDLNDTVRRELVLGARQWLAADIQVRGNHPPAVAGIEALRRNGWSVTVVTETAGQISTPGGSHFEVAGIKAVDPDVYPFYGELRLSPAAPLRQLLREDSALVSPDVLEKLHTRIGGTILVSGADFKIAGVIENEPDRFAVMPLALMRVLLTREGFERTGMLQHGSSAIHRLLIRVSENADLAEVSRKISGLFPFEEVIDYRKNAAGVAGIEEQAATYFSFLAFMILIVAALGAGLMMYTHVQQRMDTIATMKLLGATTSQVVQIYFLQIAVTAIVGAFSGFVLGAAAEHLFPWLLGPYLPFSIGVALPWKAGLEAFAAGVAIPLLLSAAPLLSIRLTRPNVLLRRQVDPQNLPRRETVLMIALAIAGSAAASTVASGATGGVAGIMILGLLGGVIACALAAVALRRLISFVLLIGKWRIPAPVRYGVLNLVRPGNAVISIVIALGLGVCFVYLAYLMEGSLLDQVMQYSPFHGANVYLLNVGPSQENEVRNFLRVQPGVRRVDLDPFVVLRLIAVNGNTHLQQIRRTWFAAVAGSQPSSLDISSGHWWTEGDPFSWIALSARAAKALGVRVGDSLTFSNGPELVKVRVAAIHRSSSADALRYHLTLSPSAVTESRVTYNGAVWAEPSRTGALQRQLRERYPSVLILNQAEIAAVMQDTAGQVAAVLRLVSAISLTGGAIILSASLFAMRFQREREISVLKALGGTRRRIALTLAAEFTVLGCFAAAVGIAMGSGLAALLGRFAFDPPLPPFSSWAAACAALGVTVAITNVAGWATGISLLRQKPSEILRGEKG